MRNNVEILYPISIQLAPVENSNDGEEYIVAPTSQTFQPFLINKDFSVADLYEFVASKEWK